MINFWERLSMHIRSVIFASIIVPLCFISNVNAQEEQEFISKGEFKPPPGVSQVGPTMIRVNPLGRTPYEHWFTANKDKMPSFEGLVIQDARTEPLQYWDEYGVDGLYLKMADYQITDGRILEIPPKGQIKPQRHLFEAGMYFFGGPGHIIIQQKDKRPQRVDYGHRSLYSVPLNARYQIFNDSDEPVRIVMVTSFPFTMDSFNSEAFAYENDFAFTDRYDAEEDYTTYFERTGDNNVATNIVGDALMAEGDAYDHRGVGSTRMGWKMSGNSIIDLHASEMPGGMFKKAHRHSSDAFILLLSGEGYSLTWPEGRYNEDRVRVDWNEGTIFVPPIYWYHQHLNPHPTESARYLAINAPPIVINLGLRFNDQLNEDLPQIEEEFNVEVEKARAGNR